MRIAWRALTFRKLLTCEKPLCYPIQRARHSDSKGAALQLISNITRKLYAFEPNLRQRISFCSEPHHLFFHSWTFILVEKHLHDLIIKRWFKILFSHILLRYAFASAVCWQSWYLLESKCTPRCLRCVGFRVPVNLNEMRLIWKLKPLESLRPTFVSHRRRWRYSRNSCHLLNDSYA